MSTIEAEHPRIWIRNPLSCWTGNDLDATNGIVVQGQNIVELVPAGSEPFERCHQSIDASAHVLMPGLINCHHHFYQTLTRAVPAALNKDLFPWLKTLYPIWANLDEDAIYQSTQLALVELLMSGCTTAVDHHYVFSQTLENATDIQVDAAQQIGARVVLTRGSMSLGQSAGGLPPDGVVQADATILQESERLIRRYHNPNEGSLCQIALAPCSPFSVTPELMRQTAKLAKQHDVLMHTHLAETEDENKFCLQQFGMRPLDYLDDVGWLHENVWLAHGIHFSNEEVARLGESKIGICHCPSSNMVLASGICPTKDLVHSGAKLGLGVDGSASNDGSNLIQEARQAMLLGKLRYGASNFTHHDALYMATHGGARLLRRPDIGDLRAGKAADLALFKVDEPRFSGHGDAVAALLLCGASQADHVMVAGQWKVKHGDLVDVDLVQLLRHHQQAALRLASAHQ
ncbi:8-oxoguanine deaminase [Echinimonas agarilytica]|uniref:8-oxoguanine deaminase n=1 Tax=Echinimonas agarilytica TaxID=1215918 RepID=A0AA41W865_9GAMM|nr:8-oxoguanine deaminase [Echinimonas agarilytica]MCM2680208.1 8-oxoguanine deaminase [Echinimonas agarilytica]